MDQYLAEAAMARSDLGPHRIGPRSLGKNGLTASEEQAAVIVWTTRIIGAAEFVLAVLLLADVGSASRHLRGRGFEPSSSRGISDQTRKCPLTAVNQSCPSGTRRQGSER